VKFNKHGIAIVPKPLGYRDRITRAVLHARWSPQTLQRYYNSGQYDRLNKALYSGQNADRLANTIQRQHHANVTNGVI